MKSTFFCRATASYAALAIALASTPAHAQQVNGPEAPASTTNAASPASTATPDVGSSQPAGAAPQESGQGLADIVVTARKVAENQQRVPVAITAFSGEALQQQGAVVVSDVAKLTPGLIITPSTSTQTSAQFTIRGQVQQDNLATLDPSVGVYVDSMYWARGYGINGDLLDIDSVQTLKGPQGTLFGRNTTGGAVLIDTNNPSFRNGVTALVSGTYGRFNEWSGTGIVNVPIIDDRLAVRVAYERLTRDGYIPDNVSGQKLDSRNEYTVRAKLLFKPTDNFTIVLSGEQYRASFLGNPYRATYLSASSPANIQVGLQSTGFACIAGGAVACFGPGIAAYNQAVAYASDRNRVSLNDLPTTYAKTQTYSATATLDTFFGAIKAVGGYRKVSANATQDLDGSNYNILSTTGIQNLSQYSGELQATGKAFNNRLSFAAGFFYFHESGVDQSTSAAIPLLNPSGTLFRGTIDNDSQGLYGQATYKLTDKLSATGGLRYSVDDKRLQAFNGTYLPGGLQGPTAGGSFTCQFATCPFPEHASFSGVSYTAGLDYQFTRDILGYAKTAKGFRSGGLNLRGEAVFPRSTRPFDPERATSYEGGLKTEFLDHKLRVNVAGYYTIDKNIQRSILLSDANGNTATVLANAGQADIYGGEFEAQVLLPYGFRIDSTAAYTHARYVSYINPINGFDQSHEPFYGVAKWTASVSPSWTQRFDFGSITLRGDAAYQSNTATYNAGFYTDAGGVIRDASTGTAVSAADRDAFVRAVTDKAHVLVNARLTATAMDDRIEVAVWGKNLTDKRDNVASVPVTALGEVASVAREPRTYGVTITLKYKQR